MRWINYCARQHTSICTLFNTEKASSKFEKFKNIRNAREIKRRIEMQILSNIYTYYIKIESHYRAICFSFGMVLVLIFKWFGSGFSSSFGFISGFDFDYSNFSAVLGVVSFGFVFPHYWLSATLIFVFHQTCFTCWFHIVTDIIMETVFFIQEIICLAEKKSKFKRFVV